MTKSKELFSKMQQIVVESKGTFVCKEFTVGKSKFYCFNYILQLPGMFETDIHREMRGIVFDENKNIVSRPLHKFFNVHEVNDFDFKKVKVIYEKLDGSMIHPLIYNDENNTKQIIFKTRMTPYSDVAVTATKFIFKEKKFLVKWSRELLKNGITPIFEYIAPSNRIVVHYNKKDVRLIALRETESGNYLDLDSVSIPSELAIVNTISKQKLKEYLSQPNIEGVVLLYQNGFDRFKLKSDWYLERHALYNYSLKQLFLLFLNNELDDVKAKAIEFDMQHVLNDIIKIETTVVNYIEGVLKICKAFEKIIIRATTKKEIANTLKPLLTTYEHNLAFNLVMKSTVSFEAVLKMIKKKPNIFWKKILRRKLC